MKLADLEFRRQGCCGEYSVATITRDTDTIQIYDDGDAGYRILRIVGGRLAGGVVSGLTEAQIDDELSALSV